MKTLSLYFKTFPITAFLLIALHPWSTHESILTRSSTSNSQNLSLVGAATQEKDMLQMASQIDSGSETVPAIKLMPSSSQVLCSSSIKLIEDGATVVQPRKLVDLTLEEENKLKDTFYEMDYMVRQQFCQDIKVPQFDYSNHINNVIQNKQDESKLFYIMLCGQKKAGFEFEFTMFAAKFTDDEVTGSKTVQPYEQPIEVKNIIRDGSPVRLGFEDTEFSGLGWDDRFTTYPDTKWNNLKTKYPDSVNPNSNNKNYEFRTFGGLEKKNLTKLSKR